MNRFSLADIVAGAARPSVDRFGKRESVLTVVDLDDADWSNGRAAVHVLTGGRIEVSVGFASRPLPAQAAPVLEALTCTLAPDGPGIAWAPGGVDDIGAIARTVDNAPLAALTLVDLLGVTSRSSVADGVVAESLAYSMLLAGPEFGAWRSRTPRRAVPRSDDPVLLFRDSAVLHVVLNNPRRHNAFSHTMRNGLLAALDVPRLDPTVEQVRLSGAGDSFSSGGDVDEFGTAPDVATAHVVRLAAHAGLAVHALRDRVRPLLHGACIGAGLEVPAFASHVQARDDAFFALPELRFGLVPGAGGTVSVTRRIGRWRTAYLALSGVRIGVGQALAWGLVDERF